jgi:conjugal transfer mating pair stabilization protein TraN
MEGGMPIKLLMLFILSFATYSYAFECQEESLACIEAGGERLINSIRVTKPCWKYAYKKRCNIKSRNNCHEISVETCDLVSERCLLTDENGKQCLNNERDYSCETKSAYERKITKLSVPDNLSSKELVCHMMCIDGNCDAVSKSTDQKNDELAKSIGQLGSIAKIKNGMIDPEKMRFNLFAGNAMSCSKKALGYSNCCNLRGGWGQYLGANCRADEKTLAKMREESKCQFVGTECVDKLFGKCLVKKEIYCCYDSVLSKTLQLGARAQLSKDLGNASSPQCGGLTLEEFTKIDMNKIDFSEFLNRELAPRMSPVSETVINKMAKDRADEHKSGIK